MEKIYRVKLNSKGMPNFSTAVEIADRPQEWISCSEKLPEEEGMFLVTATDYIFDTTAIVVGTCYFNPNYKFISAKEILAWMPLPNPWKGADDD